MRKILFLLSFTIQLIAGCKVEKIITNGLSIERSSHHLQVVQNSDKAIINWKNFSLSSKDKATFHLPSSSSAVLNRVTGKTPSQIDGHISSNGKVYLLNPNGIVIGKEGKIDTRGFVGSTMALSNASFLNNKDLLFQQVSDKAIINLGTISCEKGDIFLCAKKITNRGEIKAENGEAFLASGYKVLLKENEEDPIWIKPSSEDLDITNEGTIEALSVTLKASNNNPYSLAIQQKGLIDAKGVTKKGGKVILSAKNNTIEVAGEIKASQERNGGKIQMEADRVHMKDGSSISADGYHNGGTILIGGGFRGNNPKVYNAKQLFTEKKVNISASSLQEGNGGKVILWGDHCNLFYGNIRANGGKISGNGGLIEISSPKALAFKGKAVASAPKGIAGTLLLDPSDIDIVSGAAGGSSPLFPTSSAGGTDTYNPAVASATLNDGDINSSLGAGTNVTVRTSGGTIGSGDITINSGVAISWSTTAILTLIADRQIFKSGTGTASIASTGVGTFTAMDFQANTSNTTTGDFNGIEFNTNFTLSTVDGDITMEGHGGDMGADRGIRIEGNSTVSSTGAGDITFMGVGCGPGAAVNGCHGIQLVNNSGTGITSSGSGNITFTGTTNATGGNNDGILIQATVASSGTGNISLTGTGGSGTGSDNSEGVRVNSSSGLVQTSSSGNIIINGTGGQDDNSNNGVFVSNSGVIESTSTASNAGTISITGEGGPATTTGNNNNGLSINGSSSRISSVNGNITIDATSGATGSNNSGTSMTSSATIESTGTGSDAATITINPSTGSGGNNSPGLFLNGSTITSVDGDIGITATGGTVSTGDEGVRMQGSGLISSTGTGADAATITIDATGNGDSEGFEITGTASITTADGEVTITTVGGSAGSDNHGLLITSDTNITSTGIGDISITTTGGSSGGAGLSLSNGQVVLSGSGNLTLDATSVGATFDDLDMSNAGDRIGSATGTGDYLILVNTATLDGQTEGTGNLIYRPDVVTSIGIGTGATGTFNLDSTEVSTIQTGFNLVTIGDALSTGLVDIEAVTFNNPTTINGASITVDGTVTAGVNDVTLNVGPAGAGTFVSNAAISTSGTAAVNGASFNDTFRINLTTAQSLIISGNGGTNELIGPNTTNAWSITSDNDGTLNTNILFSDCQTLTGGTGADTFTFTGAFQVTGSIDGDAGTNTLAGPNVNNSWAVTTTNAGTLTPTGASGATTFSNIQNLTGGTSDDTFVLSDNVGVGGTIDGTSSSGNTIDYSAYTATNVVINLETGSATNLGGFANIQSFIGGAATNSVTGENAVSSWSITADDSFTVSGISFTPFEDITGGTAADTFTFAGAFRLTGSTGIDGGGGSNTIVGPNVNNAWAVTTTNAGTITPTGASGATTFSSIQNLTGGTANDTFTLSDNIGVGGTIDGTSSSGNTIDYSAYTATNVVINLQTGSATNLGGFANIQSFIGGAATNSATGANTANSWSITGDNDFSVDGISFDTFQNVTGGTAADIFTFTGAFQLTGVTGIDGAAGSNTVVGPNVNNAWAITSNNGGTITPTGASGATNFSNSQNLTGGSANDTFTISDGISVGGTINGTSSSGNEIDYSAYTSNINVNLGAGTATATGGIANIQSFIGGSATNSITGFNSNNTWNITADNAGNVSGVSFTPFQNLTGGTANDNFVFAGAFQITGAIAGGAGSNTITGPNVNNAWAITSTNAGTITPTGASGATTFSSIQNLTGGTANDTFTISDGVSVTGTINGTSSSGNSLDLSAYTSNTSVSLANGTATGTGSIANLQTFTGGSATNSFTGPNINNTWVFTAANAGTINGTFSFTPFQNVTGGNMADIFDFSSGFIVTGVVDGGFNGTNTLIAPNSVNTWSVTAQNAGTVAGISFTGIENLTGGNMADTFVFSNGVGIDGRVDGGAPAADNTLDYSQFTTPVVVLFETETSGTASNLGSGFINIGSVVGNIQEIPFNLTNQLFTSLSIAVSKEAQHHRLLLVRPILDYDQFDNIVCLPFVTYHPALWKIINVKEINMNALFEKSLEKIAP